MAELGVEHLAVAQLGEQARSHFAQLLASRIHSGHDNPWSDHVFPATLKWTGESPFCSVLVRVVDVGHMRVRMT